MTALLLLGLAGCFRLDLNPAPIVYSAPKEGRLLLHVTGPRGRGLFGSPDLEGVRVTARQGGDVITQAATNAIGAVGLAFVAPVELRINPPTSENWPHEIRPWVVLIFEKPGFQTLELPLQPEDFVETSGVRHLTRGVALRKAAP